MTDTITLPRFVAVTPLTASHSWTGVTGTLDRERNAFAGYVTGAMTDALNSGDRRPDDYTWTEDFALRTEDAHLLAPRPAAIVEQPTREVELEREVTRLRAEVERLRTEQIKGSDPRLAEFWAEAQQLATDADHCQVFDNLCEELGGPRREKDYTVTLIVPVSIRVSVRARSEEDAGENAEQMGRFDLIEYVRNADAYDLDDTDLTVDGAEED
jgi:hypothetical protein